MKNWEEYKVLFRLGIPVLLTQLGVIFVSFADTMMIGRYGTDELAAASFVNSLFVVPIVMLMFFAGGITPLIGSLYTQRKDSEAGRTLRASLQMNLLIALSLTAIMGSLYFLLDKLGQPEELMPLIKEYYLIVLATIFPMAVFNCFQQMANGTTDTVSPMIVIISANLLNVVGNYCLIFGHFGLPELGIVGAGVSTLLARIAGAVAIWLIFRLRARYKRYHEGLSQRKDLCALRRKVWVTSYPVMLQGGIECLLWTFGTVVCGWFGKIQLAAYQITNTLAQLGFMNFQSFATAVSIRVANKMGENDLKGIRKTVRCGLNVNLLLATAVSAIFYFCSKSVLQLFSEDTAVLDTAFLLIVPLVLYQFGDAIQYTYANAQRGTAVVKPLAYVSTICYVVIGMPVLYLFAVPTGSGCVGIFYSFSVVLFSASIMLILWFYHTIRKKEAEIVKL